MSKSSSASQQHGHSTATSQHSQASEFARVLNSSQQHGHIEQTGSQPVAQQMSGSTSGQQQGALKPLFRDWASI